MSSRFHRLCFSLPAMAVLLFIAKTDAATVTLTMEASGGNWQLFADASLGDNRGIASYNIPLLNVDTVIHESPWYQFNTDDFQPSGFSEFRVVSLIKPPEKTLFAAQKVIPTATPHVVYGFGQVGGTLPGTFTGGSAQTTYDAHLLLASGTYTTGVPTVSFGSRDLSISVFRTTGPPAPTMAATVVPPVPEPATLSLLGLVTVGGWGITRRRNNKLARTTIVMKALRTLPR
jgi:hypothetical protein